MNEATAFRLGVIILGAGASSRMGRPKLLLPWKGTSVIGHLIRQWEILGASQIAVVVRPNDEPLHAEFDRLDFPQVLVARASRPFDNGLPNEQAGRLCHCRIENPKPERGMFSSICCAAKWNGWRDELTSWAIVLGDQPHLQLDTLRALLDFHRDHPEAICQPTHEGHGYHPVLLRRLGFEQLKQTRAETLDFFLKQNSAQLIKCPIQDSGLALDLDTPEDYKQLTSEPSLKRT